MVSKTLEAAVQANKKFVLHLTPDTKVVITSTNASEVEEVLEALEPVEEDRTAGMILHNAWMPLLTAYEDDPAYTKEWLTELLAQMNDAG